MDRIVAYCGLVCSECEAYLATQSNDLAALEKLAARAREEYNMPDATAETARCDGCLGETGLKIGYCFSCEVRACGVQRNVRNCAFCDEYACEKLEGFFGMAPNARTTLDQIRATL
ncbi:MAG: DUF3795 domain-containing protein [Anaerolineales bacterium]|nr:DUF3795 domain-containing protein [Anaerolineales bacterium]